MDADHSTDGSAAREEELRCAKWTNTTVPSSVKAINPLNSCYDAAVFGAGLCGFGVALVLAQAGKKVLLVERRPMLGWEISAAFKCNLERTDSSVVLQVYRSLNSVRALRENRVDGPLAEIVLDQLAERHGIDVLLYSLPTDLITNGSVVTGVAIGNKTSEQVIRADLFVDATEEALLWKQTGVEWSAGDAPAVCQSFFFHPAKRGLTLPVMLGNAAGDLRDMQLHPSVREGEVRVEYTVENWSITKPRLLYERAIAYVRERVPQLAEAAVTHEGVEPLPLGSPQVLAEPRRQHASLPNLFAAGIWTIGDAHERARATQPAGRFDIGGATANSMLAAVMAPGRVTGRVLRQREIPELPVRETEVLVVGGGTAGSLGGIASGRQGVRTIVLEASTILGGMATGSGMNLGGHGVRGGLQDDFHARVRAVQPLYEGDYAVQKLHPGTTEIGAAGATSADTAVSSKYPPGAGAATLERMAAEAGTEVIYGATAIGVEMAGRRITGVVAATPAGKVLFRAQVVIDSTGDADVARMAGAPMVIGREYDGVLHCYSQVCFLMMPNGMPSATNWDSGYVDPLDIVDLTRARREGIRQVWERFAPDPFGNRVLLNICPLLGIRGGPLIVGDYVPDFLQGILPTEFEDCVGYSGAKYDCHSQDFENQQDAPILWIWMLGNRERHMGGQLPYRMMLPQNVEGVLVACRGASCTYEYNYQFRTMRNQYRLAEAAAIAATQCVRRGITPRQVDVRLVQEELHKSGALGEAVKPKPVVQERPLEELRAMLASADPKDAVWLLAHGGEPARRLLRQVVESGPEGGRFWASVALAWHRDTAALPELIGAVEQRLAERPDFTPRGRNMVPLWQSCIAMLGRIGSPEAVSVLLDVLADRSANMDALIAAIRALGRIGDPRAVPAILNLLKRDDLPRERKFQIYSLNGRWPERENALWQIELAAAEILAQFGYPQPQLVEKYLRMGHNQAKRYARKVREIAAPMAVPVAPPRIA